MEKSIFDNIQDEFRSFYYQALRDDFTTLEQLRKRYLKQYLWRLGLGGLILVVAIWGICVFQIADKKYCFFAVVLLWVLLRRALLKSAKLYKQDTKKLVLPKITAFFNNMTYSSSEQAIDKCILQNSGLFDGVDKIYCDDAWGGTYQGIKVQIAEQRLVSLSYENQKQHEANLFKGVLILFDLGKNFVGKTIVFDRRLMKWLGAVFVVSGLFFVAMIYDLIAQGENPLLAIFFSVLIWGTGIYAVFFHKYRKVNLEDVEFSKKWRVVTTNQVEARYILTPALMERMLKIKRMYSGNRIHFAFFDNKVLIAVGTNKDMFETTSLFASAFEYRRVREVIVQFYNIFAVIDEMKQKELDANIGQLKKSNRVVENM